MEPPRCLEAGIGGIEGPSALIQRTPAIGLYEGFRQPAARHQIVKTDEERITGMRREALIRGAIAMGRIDGKRLPDGQAA